MRQRIDWDGVGDHILVDNYLTWSDGRIASILECSREAVRNRRHLKRLFKSKGKPSPGKHDPGGFYNSWAPDKPFRSIFNYKAAMDGMVQDLQVRFYQQTGIVLADAWIRAMLQIPKYGIPIFRAEAWRFGLNELKVTGLDRECEVVGMVRRTRRGEE